MFQDPGQKLKKLSKFVFWLIIVVNVLVNLIAWLILSVSGMKLGSVGFVLFLLGIAISVVIAWLLSIGLYAFGEMVEDAHATRQSVERLEDKYMRDHPNQVWINPEVR